MELLRGDHITLALHRTVKPIVLRDARGELVRQLLPAEVPVYIERGYEVRGSKRRVRYICPPKPKAYVDQRNFEVDAEFWDGRGCLRFWKDQVSPGMRTVSV